MAPKERISVGKSGTERIIKEKRKKIDLLQPYSPFPKQQIFHDSLSKYRLFGGAAGPGKSWALLMEAVDLAANVHAGINTLVLRRTFPELEASIILNFRRLIPPEAFKSYNTQKQIVTWHNGSVTKFGYCKTEDDVWQYQGGEWAFVGWDELTQFTMAQWTTLSGWNRSPHMGGVMAGATNPVGPGFGWVKALWLDKKPASGMDEGQAALYNPNDYEFIPALLSDNPVYAQDENYRSKLEALPNHLRAALLEGRWDVLGGVYFDIFDRATMCCRAEEMGMKPWWPRWVSVDWGYVHPAATYWHCEADNGTTFTYRELVKDKLTPEDLAYEIVKRSGDQEKEKIRTVYLSPDAFARRQGPDTIADQMNAIFREAKFPICRPANSDRVGGAMLMYQMLRDGRWMIADHCTHIIECIPMMIRDEKNVEDVAKIDGDDPYESCFAAGTMIETDKGEKPIETVRLADKILTRKGFKTVTRCGSTGYKRIIEVIISTQRNLYVTPDHPVFIRVSGGSFYPALMLRYGEKLCGAKWWSFKARIITGIQKVLIPICETIFGTETRAFIGRFTSGIKDLFPMASTSTTLMITASITNLPIYKPYPQASTVKSTHDQGSGKTAINAQEDSAESVGNDFVPRLANRSTDAFKRWIMSLKSVSFAKISSAGIATIKSLLAPFRAGRVLGLREAGYAEVFNLSVEDQPEYFANGTLVHNCRYGLKSRYAPKAEPFETRLKRKLKPIQDPNEAMMKAQQEIAKNKKRSKPKRRLPRRFLRQRKGRHPSGPRVE